ncbi:IPT/TIG domain-containing protein [Niabella sp. 22666]|uniref:IPT/TIG domain-containing protein n=1 Tax=Niabella sp. 22666 TaxID=3453954 RepID=UPI003F8615C9
MNKTFLIKGFVVGFLTLSVVACQKTNVSDGKEVYPPGQKARVKYLDTKVSPATGISGTVVTIPISGLEGKKGQFKAYFGTTEAEVLDVSDKMITVKVPVNASSSNISIEFNGETYFGPRFTVQGKLYIDPSFNTDASQSNGTVMGITPYGNGNFIIYGSFNFYNGTTLTGLATIDPNGARAAKQIYTGPANSLGLTPTFVGNLIRLSDGRFLMGGGFTEASNTVSDLSNLARIKQGSGTNAMDSIETQRYQIPNNDAFNFPDRSWATGSSVNAGTDEDIAKVFVTADAQNYILVGNFQKYRTTFYPGSLWNNPQKDEIAMKQIISIKTDGSFDSSFNFNRATNRSYSAGNAFLNDAIQGPDGNIVITGNFTTFHDRPASRIVKINAATGLVMESFATGTGFDGVTTRIFYNTASQKYLITGLFQKYNGSDANGVAMLNTDGSLYSGFKVRTYDNAISFAKQLTNGKVVIAGTFTKYDGVARPGFAVLNSDGSLASGYNNTGFFNGYVSDVLETTASGTGLPALFIVGSFSRFDATPVANIVKVIIEN